MGDRKRGVLFAGGERSIDSEAGAGTAHEQRLTLGQFYRGDDRSGCAGGPLKPNGCGGIDGAGNGGPRSDVRGWPSHRSQQRREAIDPDIEECPAATLAQPAVVVARREAKGEGSIHVADLAEFTRAQARIDRKASRMKRCHERFGQQHFGGVACLNHAADFGLRNPHRLFAQHVFVRCCGGQHPLEVRVVRERDVHGLNQGIGKHVGVADRTASRTDAS